MHASPAVADGAARPEVPHERGSLISRLAAYLRGDRYMVNAYPPPTTDPGPERRDA